MKQIIIFLAIMLSIEAGYCAHITIRGLKEDSKDSILTLKIYDRYVLPSTTDSMAPPKIYVAKLNKGLFKFNLKVGNTPSYFSLYRNDDPKPVIINHLVEDTDDLKIELGPDNHQITGPGAFKSNVLDTLEFNFLKLRDSLTLALNGQAKAGSRQDTDRFYLDKVKGFFQAFSTIRDMQLTTLQKYKSGMNQKPYQIIKADIVGRIQSAIVSLSNFYIINGNISRSTTNMDSLTRFIELYQYHIKDISSETLALSREYVNYIYMLNQLELILENRKYTFWEHIKNNFDGILRDKLFAMRLYNGIKYEKNLDSTIKSLQPFISNPYFNQKINSLVNNTLPGTKVFDFSLPDRDGHIVSLHDFKGKLVFLDFWYTGCGPCLFYYQQCLDAVERNFLHDTDVVFITIAVDKDRTKWIKSLNDARYTSAEAVNLFTDGQGTDHPVIKNYWIKGYPSPLLISPEGNLISRNIFELGGGVHPDPDRLIKTINEYKKGHIL